MHCRSRHRADASGGASAAVLLWLSTRRLLFHEAPMTVNPAIHSPEPEEAKTAGGRTPRPRVLLRGEAELALFFDALYAGAMPDVVWRARADQLTARPMALHGKAAKRKKTASRVA